MSYCTPSTTQKARKVHKCTYCAEAINPGDVYMRWASFDYSCCTNKMHPECLSALQQDFDGDFEYTPYEGERPATTGAAS